MKRARRIMLCGCFGSHRAAALAAVCCFFGGLCSAGELVCSDIKWDEFLARQDMVWERVSTNWGDGAFIGNGHLGAMIFKAETGALKWELGHNKVTLPVMGAGEAGEVLMGARIPIGDILLVPSGKAQKETMRLDLWNAEARGEFQTDRGGVKWRSFTHATRPVIAIEIETQGDEAQALEIRWKPDRLGERSYYGRPLDANPEVETETRGDIQISVQRYHVGWLHAVALLEEKISPERRAVYISIGPSFPGEEALEAAVRAVREAKETGFEQLLKTHRDWWHEFWPSGAFVSLPDSYWENFYWLQMYKLASATRADSVVLDLCGPWLNHTGWPYTAWNLNVQLTYWPQCGANRLELGESLYSNLDKYFNNLVLNVQPEFRTDSAAIGWSSSYDLRSNVHPKPDGSGVPWSQTLGDLPWLCHNYWLHYRHSMDDARLRDKLFPLLKRAVNFYLHFLREKGDGRLHLIPTHSPEYATAPDCNFDLALLRWGCKTLIKICERLKIADPMLEVWQETLDRLVEYPTDETGFMIGAGVPLKGGHRHYSHMLMAYPLYLLTKDNPDERALIEKSLRYWIGLTGNRTGFTYTGAASIAAALGNGDEALGYLEGLKPFLKTNTMYTEGNDYPCIETPISGSQSLHDMLLQSWGDCIRVFPAVPSVWADAAIHNMRAEGAFLVSAVRAGGKTRFVRVRSLAGEPCRVWADLPEPVALAGSGKLTVGAGGVFEVALQRGEEAVLYSGGEKSEFKVVPVHGADGAPGGNRFGLKQIK